MRFAVRSPQLIVLLFLVQNTLLAQQPEYQMSSRAVFGMSSPRSFNVDFGPAGESIGSTFPKEMPIEDYYGSNSGGVAHWPVARIVSTANFRLSSSSGNLTP